MQAYTGRGWKRAERAWLIMPLRFNNISATFLLYMFILNQGIQDSCQSPTDHTILRVLRRNYRQDTRRGDFEFFLPHSGDTLHRWRNIWRGCVDLLIHAKFHPIDARMGCGTPKLKSFNQFLNVNAPQGRIICSILRYLKLFSGFYIPRLVYTALCLRCSTSRNKNRMTVSLADYSRP